MSLPNNPQKRVSKMLATRRIKAQGNAPDAEIVRLLGLPSDATTADVVAEIKRMIKESGKITEAQRAVAKALGVPLSTIRGYADQVRKSRSV